MKKQSFKIVATVILITLLPVRVLSAEPLLVELKRNVSEKMEQVDNLSFSFSQETVLGGSTRTVTAEVYFRRPDNLILKYTEPDVQKIYISSDTIYTYIPSIKQATRQQRTAGELSNIAGVTLSVIFSEEPFKYLEENFELKAYELDDFIKLEGKPKSGRSYENIEISFSKADYYPATTAVSAQNFKSVTTFSNYRKNRDFDKSFFKFSPGSETNLIQID